MAVSRGRDELERILGTTSLRDGPLETLWGEGKGNFRAAGIFFRYQIPYMNFFRP